MGRSRRAVLGIAAAIAAVAFGALAWAVTSGWPPLVAIDTSLATLFGGYAAAHPGWVTWWTFVGVIGGPGVFQVLGAAAIITIVTRAASRGRFPATHRRLVAFLLLGVGGGGLLSLAIKAAVARPRPPGAAIDAFGNSFPSGHALGVSVAAGAVLLLALPWLSGWRAGAAIVVAALVVALVCFDRLALDVHYLSDVLAGVLIGVAWVCAVALVCDRVWPVPARVAGLPTPPGASEAGPGDTR